MNATKPNPHQVTIAEPAKSDKLDPRWNRARELLASGRKVAMLFATEIESLRAEYLHEGHGGDRRSKNQVSQDEKLDREKGFVAAVERELSISPATAYRWINDALRFRQMQDITIGEVREIDGKAVTEEVRARAEEAIAAMQEDPSVRPARVWAGLWGGAKTKGVQRAAVDHGMNISNAIAKLKTSLPHWRKLDPHDRAHIETEFKAIKHLLEGTLL